MIIINKDIKYDFDTTETIEINHPTKGKYEVKIIRMMLKVSDLFDCEFLDISENRLLRYNGYVPKIIPGGGGDYVCLDIDITTGKILNWYNLTHDDLQNFVDTRRVKWEIDK